MVLWRFQLLLALLAVVVFSKLTHKNVDDADNEDDLRTPSTNKKSKGRKMAKVSKKHKYELEEPEFDKDIGKKSKGKKNKKLAKVSKKEPRYELEDNEGDESKNKHELQEPEDNVEDIVKKSKGKKDKKLAKVSRKKPRYEPEDSEGDESEYSSEENFESVTMKQIRDLHKKFDADGDGKASLEEILNFAGNIHNETLTKAVPDILKALDHIKDGKLSLKEVLDDLEESEEAQMMTQDELKTMKELETLKFGAADADGDGKLDLKEVSSLFYPEPHSPVLQVSVREFIKKRDTDGDGKISADEFWTKEDQQGLEDDYNYNSTHNMSSSKIGEDIFKKLDKDGDGLLDTDELMEWESGQFHMKESFQELFDLADKDKDHHLSVREIEKAKRDIAQIEAQYHLMQWMEHFEL